LARDFFEKRLQIAHNNSRAGDNSGQRQEEWLFRAEFMGVRLETHARW
jgi:hypothetical protein